ncbi:unknown [Odoribacter sp. CAG:788]|nr:unknown [Odoribacter sp. CAG:788]
MGIFPFVADPPRHGIHCPVFMAQYPAELQITTCRRNGRRIQTSFTHLTGSSRQIGYNRSRSIDTYPATVVIAHPSAIGRHHTGIEPGSILIIGNRIGIRRFSPGNGIRLRGTCRIKNPDILVNGGTGHRSRQGSIRGRTSRTFAESHFFRPGRRRFNADCHIDLYILISTACIIVTGIVIEHPVSNMGHILRYIHLYTGAVSDHRFRFSGNNLLPYIIDSGHRRSTYFEVKRTIRTKVLIVRMPDVIDDRIHNNVVGRNQIPFSATAADLHRITPGISCIEGLAVRSGCRTGYRLSVKIPLYIVTGQIHTHGFCRSPAQSIPLQLYAGSVHMIGYFYKHRIGIHITISFFHISADTNIIPFVGMSYVLKFQPGMRTEYSIRFFCPVPDVISVINIFELAENQSRRTLTKGFDTHRSHDGLIFYIKHYVRLAAESTACIGNITIVTSRLSDFQVGISSHCNITGSTHPEPFIT